MIPTEPPHPSTLVLHIHPPTRCREGKLHPCHPAAEPPNRNPEMGDVEDLEDLSRREREVMYITHRLGEVTAETVQNEVGEGFSYSSARRYLSILHEKGLLLMRKEDNRYCYRPVQNTHHVGLSLLRRTIHLFFKDSTSLAITSLLGEMEPPDQKRQLEEIERLLQEPVDH